jgi:hypothetical protein
MPNANILEGYVSVAQIADDFKRKPRTILRWMDQTDGLPYVKLGRERLIHIETARQWMLGRLHRPNSTARRRRLSVFSKKRARGARAVMMDPQRS